MAYYYREVVAECRQLQSSSPNLHIEHTVTGTIESPRLSPPRPTPLSQPSTLRPPPPPPSGYRGVYTTALSGDGTSPPSSPTRYDPLNYRQQLLSPPNSASGSRNGTLQSLPVHQHDGGSNSTAALETYSITGRRQDLSSSKGPPAAGPQFAGTPRHTTNANCQSYLDSNGESRTVIRDVSILKRGLHPPAARPGGKTAMDWVRYEDHKARSSPVNRRASSPFRNGTSRFGGSRNNSPQRGGGATAVQSSPTRTYDASYFVKPIASAAHDNYVPRSSVIKQDYPGTEYRNQLSSSNHIDGGGKVYVGVSRHYIPPPSAAAAGGPRTLSTVGPGEPSSGRRRVQSPTKRPQGPEKEDPSHHPDHDSSWYSSTGAGKEAIVGSRGGSGGYTKSPRKSLMESATPRGPLVAHGAGMMSPIVGRR